MSEQLSLIDGLFNKTSLRDVLNKFDITTEAWGTGGAKSVEDLLHEIEEGETALYSDGTRLVRVISLVGIDVFFEQDGAHYKLVETEQRWIDGSGRQRVRNLPTTLGEKMKPHESPFEAAQRGMKEELGMETLLLHALATGQPQITERTSDSYPGLESQYWVYGFSVNLDANTFNPHGYEENDGKKITCFTWIQQ